MEATKRVPLEDPRRKSRRKKDLGWLGPQDSGKGWHATEYSTGNKIFGKETEYPTFVPGMTNKQLGNMMTDIIPNRKPIPDDVRELSSKNARKRILSGKSPFYSSKEK